jgi:nitrite reductase (NO-forming)
MITRRTALLGAAVAALVATAPALAADDLKLPRQAVELVAPPFVHPHEQVTKEGPKIIEFKLRSGRRKSSSTMPAPNSRP